MGNAIKRTILKWREDRMDERRLLEACKVNNWREMLKILEKERIEPNRGIFSLIPNDGRNVLHVGVIYGRLEIVKYLLNRYDIDVDKTDMRGWSGLHLAIMVGDIRMVKLLLECGANMNKWTIDGYIGFKGTGLKSPIYLAKYFKRWEILDLLRRRRSGEYHKMILNDIRGFSGK